MDFLHKVEALIILDGAGERIFTKYYPTVIESSAPKAGAATSIQAATSSWGTLEKQRQLETNISAKARDPKRAVSTDCDIMLIDGHTVVFEVTPEVTIAVVGGADENEMVLVSVLQCLSESLQQLLKVSTLEKRALLEKYDAIVLVADEMVDDGVILETGSCFVVGDVQPFETDSSTDGARKALSTINKYIKQNL
jgi:hypothetical protein